ncbi:hypothetical protein BGZ79_001926 [Entomortierella chlamydospora]|nr:hypothetical protein BGZ79_001926 [Entomortierella chlamydospora]
MVSITIQLEDPYLALPSDKPISRSASLPSSSSASFISPDQITPPPSPLSSLTPSYTPHSNLQPQPSQPSGTTPLRGTLILTLNKPIRVVSLAIKFDGSSFLSLSTRVPSSPPPTNTNKHLAHYSRQHICAKQFLIEPKPDPDHYITLVASSAASVSASAAVAPITAPASVSTSGSTNSPPRLLPNQIAYPFEINVPNNIPPSVFTPYGGTAYQLTAELTTAKSPSAIKSFFSTAGLGSTSVKTAVTTLLVYRAGFPHDPFHVDEASIAHSSHGNTDNESDNDVNDYGIESNASLDLSQEQDREDRAPSPLSPTNMAIPRLELPAETDTEIVMEESRLVPDTISCTWPGRMEASIMVPFVHLPPRSKLDLHVRISFFGDQCILIKYLEAALWERAIFRVSKGYKSQQEGQPERAEMAVAGIRERVVTTQRMDSCWPKDNGSSNGNSTRLIEKVIRFTTPNPIRERDQLYGSRSCNPSTFGRIYKDERLNLEEDVVDPSTVKLGAIDIEIQHFLRCTLMVTGPKSGPVEKVIGDIPVVIRGVPGGPECDRTGLPTYLGSFATSLASVEERRSYEESTRSRMSSIGSIDDIAGDLAASLREHHHANSRGRNSVFSLASIAESHLLPEDFESDDAFLAVLGIRTARTPPTYEDSLGGPPLNAACNELQLNSSANAEVSTRAAV